MMRKKVVLAIIAIALLACVLLMTFACESYKADPIEGGEKDAVVESNGGLVVKQGKYLYFVNGYSGYLTEKGKQNWFGNVTKGAIVRVTYNADGTLGDDYTVVVPKSVMADSTDVGFSIYGEWIYYVSPSAEEDRSGKVQTDTLQFLRTKIDGTDTQLILEWASTSVRYNYTSSALLIYDSTESKLYSKDLSASKFDEDEPGDIIDEDVASVYFTKNEKYDPKASTVSVADYVLYTKNSEKQYEYSNTLYISGPRGASETKKTLIDENTFTSGKYNIKVIATSVTDEKLAIYYTKTSYVGTSSSGTVVGTFAYEFQDKGFNFSSAKETQLSTEELSSIYPISYAAGIVKTGSNARIYYTDGTPVKTYGSLDLSTLLTAVNDTFYFLNSDNVLMYFPMDGNSNVHYAYTTGEKAMTSFTGVEYFDGYFYFILDDEYDYMARVKLSEINVYSGKDAAVTPIRIVSAEDQAKMDEAAKNADSDSEK